ncbi:MAG: aromatic amino acid lyase [Chrysiogenales bacterium]|nr:MAG: aromatic amino acid lyase [Chrysiogenales bacterium]
MKTHISDISISGQNLSLREILEIARGGRQVRIGSDPDFIRKITRSNDMLRAALEKGTPVYGVNTGYGKSCGKRMAREVALKNGFNLLRFHGCGTGEPVGIPETRAAMLTRILCFSRGYSGVTLALMERLADFLNLGITPVIPSEGSVGASGDLTPMSYVGASLMGQGEVWYRDRRMKAAEALREAGLEPYSFEPKEPLAIMNGTSTMTGIACLVIERAHRIMDAAIGATALSIHALMGNAHHYVPAISRAKPHPGQEYVARRIAKLIETDTESSTLEAKTLETLQDPYSIRCAPQILGVLLDALDWVTRWVEIEANSANDNPLIDPENGSVIMGGNFYGGHIVFAMDALKSALASAADMTDRQVALMVDPHMNRGLPADLVRAEGDGILYNHGFKAMSIASSALAAEALKATMPAASFSRSTESHNQDKVSMGTIGARDAARICDLTEKAAAIHLLAAAQACEIRGNIEMRPGLSSIIEKIRSLAEPVFDDRPMDLDIAALARAISDDGIFSQDNE